MIAENQSNIANLRGEHGQFLSRLSTAEGAIDELKDATKILMEQERSIEKTEENILGQLSVLQEQLSKVDAGGVQLQQDFQSLANGAEEFQQTSSHKFHELTAQGIKFEERLDFLMQASEMMKRKSRETNKSNTAKFGEVTDEQEKHTNQLAALERQLKRQERDLRAVDNRTNRAENAGPLATLQKALPGSALALTGAPGGGHGTAEDGVALE